VTVIDIEAKIWKFSNTGMKMHCFDGGVALCNSNIRRFASDAGIDYSEAQVNYNLCFRCVIRFEAAIEAAEQITEVEPAEQVQPAKVMTLNDKIWKYSNIGTTVHCFDGGVALCRSSIRRFTYDAGIDYTEAQAGHKLCKSCDLKFDEVVARTEVEQVTETRIQAPEGYAQGQAVVVQRPGRQPITGTVAHIHTAPGYVAVLDDRHHAITTYPTNFVSHVETDDAQDCVDAGPECTCPAIERLRSGEDNHYIECPTTTATEEEETMTSNPNAGTYRPNKPGSDTEPLVLQYGQIFGVVYQDGRYSVLAGSNAIAKGELDGTEGSLMAYFTEIAQRWSALVDEVMAEEAAERAERIAAHHAETTIETAHQGASIDELITLVDALGGRYHAVVGPRALSGDAPSYEVDFHTVIEVLKNATHYGFHVDIKDRVEGNWYLALTDTTGKVHGRYHRM
jgi:hypothetical protein